jgi:uncharacterized membrane-anchored protein YhcB (DUF1043 family)
MQCKDLEVVIEKEGFAPLPESARTHLADCAACQGYVADLTAIVATAHLFPVEVEPPARAWVSLRAQLESEGIIKDSSPPQLEVRHSWSSGFNNLFTTRTLATAAVGLFVVGAVALQWQKPLLPPSAQQQDALSEVAMTLDQQENDLAGMHLASATDVDTSLRQNLKTVDDFIADCKHRVKEEPQDTLTREYLSTAYEQKAELLSAIMERGGSVN